MAQVLKFYDEKHVYELDGVEIPSVSEIIRFISRETYADVSQYALDNAANRGKLVHKACEQMIKFGSAEVEDDIVGYIRAFMKFCEEHSPEFLYSEKAMACPEFAGTIDIGCRLGGKRTIIDIKTVGTVHKVLVKAQLNGYKRLDEHVNGVEVEQLFCLQLMADGAYRLYPVAIDSTEFDACLALHQSMAKKHKRGAIE